MPASFLAPARGGMAVLPDDGAGPAQEDEDDELAPSRGILLGALLGLMSLGALLLLSWWASS